MFKKLFKDKMQRHIERKDMYERQIALLKSKQRVEYENVVTTYKNKKVAYQNDVINQLDNLQARIKMIKDFESAQLKAFDKEMNVELQKIDNKFNSKILNLTNDLTTLTNLIEKEEKDLNDLIEPLKTSPKKRPLLESGIAMVEISEPVKKVPKKKKTTKKASRR